MIKTVGDTPIIDQAKHPWLDLESIAGVTVTSEDPDYPIESALTGVGDGWRASAPGVQRVVLQFHSPTVVRRMRLVFEERSRTRTQEFALTWQRAGGGPEQPVVRQQFTFAPPGTPVETEDYATELRDVERLVLTIVADIADRAVLATLKEWRIGS